MPNTLLDSSPEPRDVATLTVMDILNAETFEARLSALQASGAPDWLIDVKRTHWERFDALPMPARKDELWRFARTDRYSLEGYHLAPARSAEESEGLVGVSRFIDNYSGKLVFADDQLVFEEANSLKEQGVVLTTLEQALTSHSELIKRHFMEQTPDLGSQKFEALHGAYASSGVFLYVPKGVVVEQPIVVRHWSCADGSAHFPHTLVVAEDNAQVSVVDVFESQSTDTRHLVCGHASINAGSGGRVFYKAVQNWNLNTTSLHLNTVTAGRDSQVTTVQLNVGSSRCRNEQHTRITGPGANVENYSLNVATGEQEMDQRTLQTHSAPHSRSDLLYKNVLLDTARTIFSGLIRVDENAQQTDAYQTNRNLLLSDSAEANALPGLEILANDVKCSHGATTGNLPEEELFYLQARGIPRRKAQELLVFGFFEEIIGKVDNEQLQENLRELIQNKLHGI